MSGTQVELSRSHSVSFASSLGVLAGRLVVLVRDQVPVRVDRLERVELHRGQSLDALLGAHILDASAPVNARYFASEGRGMIRIDPGGREPVAAIGLVGHQPLGDLDAPALELGGPLGRARVLVEPLLLVVRPRRPSS